MIRYLTAGESHGKALIVIVEGLPAGLDVAAEDIASELSRRRLGYGRGPRMRFEQDQVTLVGGVRHGRTLGSPIAIEIANTEWERNPEKWQTEMSPAAEDGPTAAPLTQIRPGHADLAGMQKYGFTDARDVLERASARETAARVAAGTVAKALLAQLGVQIVSHVIQMGPVRPPGASVPAPPTWTASTRTRSAASTSTPPRRWSPRSRRRPRRAIRSAASSKPSPTACPSAWAATCTGIASSTAPWPRPS